MENQEKIEDRLIDISSSIDRLEQALLIPISISYIAETIMENIETELAGCIDYDSAEMEIHYNNKIELTNIDYDLGNIEDEIIATLRNNFLGKTIAQG